MNKERKRKLFLCLIVVRITNEPLIGKKMKGGGGDDDDRE